MKYLTYGIVVFSCTHKILYELLKLEFSLETNTKSNESPKDDPPR